MSLRDRMAKGMSITLTDDDEAAAASMKPTVPVTGPGQTMQITALRKQIEELKTELAKRDDVSIHNPVFRQPEQARSRRLADDAEHPTRQRAEARRSDAGKQRMPRTAFHGAGW